MNFNKTEKNQKHKKPSMSNQGLKKRIINI